MVDRRRHHRFELGVPVMGHLRILQDVVLERMGADDLTVISPSPTARGDELLIHISGRSGRVDTLSVRSVASMPVPTDAGVRHRVRYQIVGPGSGAQWLGGAGRGRWEGDETMACVIVRRSPVRVLNVSAQGCLLETPVSLGVGISAMLELEMEGKRHIEMIRVCRSSGPSGMPGRLRAGTEFLPLYEASTASIRQFVARLEMTQCGVTPPPPSARGLSRTLEEQS